MDYLDNYYRYHTSIDFLNKSLLRNKKMLV